MCPSETRSRRMTASARRQQILDCAFRLVSEQGYKSVSIRDIAKAAQVNEALIYRHFPTKDQLLRAILTDTIEKQPLQSREVPETLEEFCNHLQHFVDYFLARNGRDATVIRIAMYSVLEGFPLPDEFNIKKEGAFLHWFVQSIERGKASWGFNPLADPKVSISLFIGGLMYFVLQRSVSKVFTDEDETHFRRLFAESFVKSLGE